MKWGNFIVKSKNVNNFQSEIFLTSLLIKYVEEFEDTKRRNQNS
jgi:hypothetical protein